MAKIKIKVSKYYGVPSFYSVMPNEIFDTLELACLKGEEFALVEKEQFDKMVHEHELKMQQCTSK